MTKTVVALYDDFPSAQRTVQDLADADFRRDDISLMANNADGIYSDEAGTAAVGTPTAAAPTAATDDTSGTATGAGIGAAVGGIGGLLVGLGALAIPGIGPVVAAGPLAATLVGAGTGALAGGLIGALTDAGVPEEEAGYYAEGVRRGGTLVAVRADEADVDRAAALMERHDPVDIETRASQWRESGWTGFDAEAAPYTAAEMTQDRAATTGAATAERTGDREAHIPIVEENVQVGKREVERGGVRVRSYVTERPVDEAIQLRDETVHVERRPVDRPADPAEAGEAFKERWVEVKETDEEAVISKEARVVEEVVVGKDAETREEHIRDKVRRTDVEVENIEDTNAPRAPETPRRP
ncbi:YsnF/AvaK domain-containing protein [Rhodospirillaceae bacterium SYSU D60014]|uniref:YsnF/AvaK domain-containing protein n=1 Tax=Virgifigura deserti TaxID=2268457 RepID=UPI000E65F2C7